MSLRTVEIFCEVAQRRSFSKAADAQEVSQSYVSQAVHALEKELQVNLIDRSQRPLQLTPAGQVYFEGCQQVLDQFRMVEDQVRAMRDQVIGKVRVSAIYSVGLLQMNDCLNEFRERYPDAVLELEYNHPSEVYSRVASDEVHVGLVSFPKAGAEFEVIPWLDQRIVLVTPPSHPLANRESIRIRELNSFPMVTFDKGLAFRKQLDEWLSEQGVEVSISQHFDSVSQIREAVQAGAGVALLPEPTIRQEVKHGFLRIVPIEDVCWSRPIAILRRSSRPLSLAARKFVELLQDKSGWFCDPEPEQMSSGGG